jgi:DNA-binding MltR family transcriptional regulator
MPNPKEQKEPRGDGAFWDLNQLTASLAKLDERGLIFSVAAFAEEVLGSLLKAFMRPTDATHQLLDGFNAPLGTFSSRTKAAYSLGLIEKEQFEDLEHLRKIRNEMAHTWQPLTFEHSKILGHIKAMNYSSLSERFPETPFAKVHAAATALLVELSSAAHQIEEKGQRVQVTGSRLVAGFTGDFDQQMATVRDMLADIDKHLSTESGEKRAFFVSVLKRLGTRFYYVEIMAPQDRQSEVIALRADLNQRISNQSRN